MLGSDFCLFLRESGHQVAPYRHDEMDVRDMARVMDIVSTELPDCVIHAAAMTNVDACERDPESGYAANALGTWNIALACARSDAMMVYVSSCGIFDGTKTESYTEFDQPSPLTHYARSKYLGEKYTEQHCARHFVVRPGWLFGGSSEHKRNFVEARRREALSKPELMSANDKFGSPTYTMDFAAQVMALVKSEAFGTYHAANPGFVSRHEYVSEAIKALGLSNPVQPVGSDAFPRSAPVPNSEVLDNLCLRMRGLLVMRPWEEALRDYVAKRLLSGENQ